MVSWCHGKDEAVCLFVCLCFEKLGKNRFYEGIPSRATHYPTQHNTTQGRRRAGAAKSTVLLHAPQSLTTIRRTLYSLQASILWPMTVTMVFASFSKSTRGQYLTFSKRQSFIHHSTSSVLGTCADHPEDQPLHPSPHSYTAISKPTDISGS
jgi:hypothetical protein